MIEDLVRKILWLLEVYVFFYLILIGCYLILLEPTFSFILTYYGYEVNIFCTIYFIILNNFGILVKKIFSRHTKIFLLYLSFCIIGFEIILK